MKKWKLLLLLLSCFIESACERDDICAESTPTTPLLVIDFFDADNPESSKIPANLAIFENGETDPNNIRLFNTSSISIPLRTDDDASVFQFIINSTATAESEETPNADLLTFTYQRTEDFVSKACGFRVTFDDLLVQQEGGEDNSWIQDLEILTPTIVNDTISHIRVLH